MRRIPFEVWLAVLILALHIYPVLVPANSLMNWFPSDDAFYYFKTAQNIAEGHGITFDGLGRDSGFHPLWMLVITPLFALARFDLILPLRLVVVLSSLINAASAVILYRLAKRFLAAPAAAFVALFWAFYPYIHTSVVEMGLESGLSAFFIILLLYRVTGEEFTAGQAGSPERRWIITGLVGALTILARLDNVFLVALLGAWLALRPVRLRYLAITDLVSVALGVLWSFQAVVGFGPQYEQFATSSVVMVAAALIIRLVLYYLAGLYARPANTKELILQSAKAAGASLAGSVLLAGAMLVLQAMHLFAGFPRLTLIYEAGFALAAVLLVRLVAALITWRGPLDGTKPTEAAELQWSRLWQPTLTRALCYFVPIGVILLIYMGASQWYFGTPMPVSGQIKRWWGVLPNVIYGRPTETFTGMLGFIPKASPWSLLEKVTAFPSALPKLLRGLLYGLPALALAIRQCRQMSRGTHLLGIYPLFFGSLAQLISYTGTGYLHMRGWYWVAPTLGITLLLGMLMDALLCWLEELKPLQSFKLWKLPYAPGVILAALLTAAVVINGSYDMVRRMPMSVRADKADRYLWGIREMERQTEPGSYIGSSGGGIIAYFANDRKIINMDGLMNTYAYYQALRSGHASEYLDQIGLDYVYTSGYVITSSDPYFQFKGRLERITEFEGSALFRWVKR